MNRNAIKKVAVAGGGITALSAAATLKRRIPRLEVQLILTAPATDALADRIINTLPSICQFHRGIGLTEADTISGAASGRRFGTLMHGWAEEMPDYVHAYGPYGVACKAVPFHQLWLRDAEARGLPAFDRFSPAAEMARAGEQSPDHLDLAGYGLQLTPERYAAMMRAYASHLGVHITNGEIVDVVFRSEDGFIESVSLANGGRVAADLFVDCTGPAALLHGRMEVRFEDWSEWLPCDRIIMAEVDADPAATLLDRVAAIPFGWQWLASSPQVGSAGIAYSSARASDADANRQLGAAVEAIVMHQGRKQDFWSRNCVAIGDAAVSVEPLEWTNLHLVHSQLDRLVEMMPGRDCAAVETAQFNRESGAEADRVRDFLCMHYICSKRREPFWRDAASVQPPPSLQHSLSLFRERGRLPYYQEETFSRDSWLTVLLGQGIRPRRIDPLADLVSSEEAAQAFHAMRQSLRLFSLPSVSSPPELNPHGIR